jgi:hypothetical protein
MVGDSAGINTGIGIGFLVLVLFGVGAISG